MRAIRLLIYFFAGLFLGGYAVLSSAETIPATSTAPAPIYGYYDTAYNKGATGSLMEVCRAFAPARGKDPATILAATAYGVYARCWNDAGATVMWAQFPQQYYCESNPYAYHSTSSTLVCPGVRSCPANQGWTLSGSSCTRPDCVLPQVRDPANGVCKAPPCSAPGTTVGTASSVYSGTGSATGVGFCFDSCGVTAGGGCNSVKSKAGTWSFFCTGPFTATGESCVVTASPEPKPDDDPAYKCAQEGMASGTVNGVVVCTPAAENSRTTGTTDTTTTTVSKDATGTTTGTTTGSTSSTSSASTDANGTKTTTTTTTTVNPDGTSSTTSSTKVGPDEEGEDEEDDWGTPGEEGALEEKAVGLSSIASVSMPTSMSCPAAFELPHGWGTVSYQPACELAAMIRPITLAFAWLVAGLVVIGGFKEG